MRHYLRTLKNHCYDALSISLAALLLSLVSPARAADEIHPPIPIPFTLAEPGYVTLVIEDAGGKRVRNLVSETPFPAGENTAWWDGLDDLGRDTEAAAHALYHIPGKFVEPGSYRVRGLVRPRLDLRYEFSVYHEGNPPWKTTDKGSQWLANHTPPSAVLFVPEAAAPARPGKPAPGGQIIAASKVSEGGSGVAWLDLGGHKLHGQMWIGGVWTGATHLAYDAGDTPVPGVYAYTAAAWPGDKYNENRSELRLFQLLTTADRKAAPRDTRFGFGEDRPVLTPNFTLPFFSGGDESDQYPLSGLAVRNGLVVVALRTLNQLLFVDAKAGKVLTTATLENPRGVAFDGQGRLIVVSGRRVLRFAPPTPRAPLSAPAVLAAEGLEDPQQLTLDAAGNLYVSDLGASHQVKVFSAEGKALRAIGKPGKPGVGPYDPEHMNNPAGVTIDSRGRLWVAEHEFAPKRLSVWTTDGHLEQAFYGPPRYGGGGRLDGADPSRFFYADAGGIEFKLDWQTGKSVPAAVYYRPECDTLKLTRRGDIAPEQPLHAGGHTYLTDAYNENPTGGSATVSLWVLENGVARPVAAIGQANDWDLLNDSVHFCARWTGQLQARRSGPTTFAVTADDGARLWVDGNKILDTWRQGQGGANTATVTLEAGKRYDLKLEYYQTTNNAGIHLMWDGDGKAKQIIPSDALFADAKSTTPGGLMGEYFRGAEFKTPLGKRLDPKIDFNFSGNGLGLNKDNPFAGRLPKGMKLGREKERVLFAWSDLNGDGRPQPEEITTAPGDTRAVSFMPDLSAVTATGRLFRPQGFTKNGAPIFDAAKAETLARETQKPVSSGGGQAWLGGDGWLVLTTAPPPFAPQGIGGVLGGVARWSYPSLWPGLHAGHNAPLAELPGEVLATTRLLGPSVKFKEAGVELWAINGDKGNVYLFTTDGLFVATLFKDGRTAAWDLPKAERGMSVSDVSLSAESFWPSIAQTPDGKVYLVVNWPSLIRVDGLEKIRRLPESKIEITPDRLKEAQAYFIQSEAARQAAGKSTGPLTVAHPAQAPQVDGKLDEWPAAGWITIDERTQQVGDWGHRKVKTEAALAVGGDRLYAVFKMTDRDLLNNSGESLPMLFKTGGALDLMLGADPAADPKRRAAAPGDLRLLVTRVKGRTVAMLYRQVVSGTGGRKYPFTSPLRTVTFDRVDEVSGDVALATQWTPDPKDKNGRLGTAAIEFSVPLATLGLKPQAGLKLRGDLGVLRGNGAETMQRAYWSNKASGITADLPSEAELLPQLWGEFVFE